MQLEVAAGDVPITDEMAVGSSLKRGPRYAGKPARAFVGERPRRGVFYST